MGFHVGATPSVLVSAFGPPHGDYRHGHCTPETPTPSQTSNPPQGESPVLLQIPWQRWQRRASLSGGPRVLCAPPADGGRGVLVPQRHTRFSTRRERFSGKEEEDGVTCRVDDYSSDSLLQIDPSSSSGR
ncbi:hypothetical protein PAL_GLEAN10013242 [Pteropus alecto]|uniref:Uncharacterized protein n=1 Tax=Pteropus alecto TaxID=9402 RepID=L5KEI4_PTEAL|nr:hypothetical protein PAL_GLEAN10013242 [Pteropus alecto]